MSASNAKLLILVAAIGAAVRMPSAAPHDDVLAERRLAWRSRPGVSPDGRFVAYTIFDPPVSGTPGDQGAFIPSGVPAAIAGSRLFVATVASGRSVQVPLDGCSSCTAWSPSWSPDGKKIAFYSDAGGLTQLWSYDTTSGRAARIAEQKIKIKLFSEDSPIWSPDGTELYVMLDPGSTSAEEHAKPSAPVVRVQRSGLETTSENAKPGDAAVQALSRHQRRTLSGSIAAVNTVTRAVRVLVPADTDPPPVDMKLSGSGRWLAYLSIPLPRDPLDNAFTGYASIVAVSTAGQQRHVLDNDVQPVLTGLEVYDAAYLWRPSAEQLVYQKRGRLWAVNLEGDRKPMPLAVNSERLSVHRRNRPAFTRDGQHLLFLSKGETRRLSLLPMDGGPLRLLEIGGDSDTYDGTVLSNADTLWQPEAQVVHVAMVDSRSGDFSINRVNVATGASAPMWRHHGILEFADVPQRAREPIGVFEDFTTTQDLYVFDRTFSARRRLTHVNPGHDDPLAAFETFSVSVPGYDGARWNARTTVISPRSATTNGSAGGPPPGIVVIYPGADPSRATRVYSGGRQVSIPIRFFTSRGYAVLLAEAALTPEGSAGHFAREVTDAVLPQVYAAADKRKIDLNRVALMGHSYGGFATLAVIATTNRFRAAIAVSSAVVDPIGAWGRPDSSGVVFAPWVEQRALMAAPPWADLNRYVMNSPFLQADRIRTPLLLIHGEGDESFPEEEPGKLFAALNRLGRTAQLATYPRQGHALADWSHASASDALERISAFLSRYLTQ